jgi:hypothetical protein
VSAEQGSKTLVGEGQDRINWKKFEVLGDVLLPIMKSQGTAYPNLTKHDAARELVLDCRMPTDDEVSKHISMACRDNVSFLLLTCTHSAGTLRKECCGGKLINGAGGPDEEEVPLVCQVGRHAVKI